jgi:GNAT superfamily N-acetyltransferase
VAYEKTDPDFLYGSIIADPTEQRVPDKSGSLHWWPALVLFVFVKQNYRREGIGRALFSAVGVDVTKPFLYACNTVTASRLASKAPLAKFNPLAARFPKNDNR